MNFGKTKWMVEGFAILIATAATLVGWPFRFSYTSVCSKCGAEQHAQEWKLPGTDLTFFTEASVTATPLSKYLSSSGLLTTHSHDWLFAAGGGNGVSCAIGQGRYLWSFMREPQAGQLLETIRVYDGLDAARNFLKAGLDPNLSRGEVWTMVVLFPTNGFSNKAQYHAWLLDYDLDVARALTNSPKFL
jgi:hypothetical protein